jgi:hypothetical protein
MLLPLCGSTREQMLVPLSLQSKRFGNAAALVREEFGPGSRRARANVTIRCSHRHHRTHPGARANGQPHAGRDNGGVVRLAMAGAAATPQVRDR